MHNTDLREKRKMSTTLKVYLGFVGAFFFSSLLGLDSLKDLAFWGVLILTVYYAFGLIRKVIRKFLWRIRRKLILSYILVGFIPLILFSSISILAFWIFMGQATTEMFNSALDSYLIQTKIEGRKLMHLISTNPPDRVLEVWYEDQTPEDRGWIERARVTLYKDGDALMIQGEGPPDLPEWMKGQDFMGMVLRDSRLWLASIHHDRRRDRGSLLIEVPVTSRLLDLIGKKIGANIGYVLGGQGVKDEFEETMGRKAKDPIWPVWWDLPVAWISLPDQFSWDSGERIALAGQLMNDDDDEDDEEVDKMVEEQREERSAKEKDGLNIRIGPDDKEDKKDGLNIEGDGKDSHLGAFAINTNVSRIYDHIFSRSSMLQKFVYALMAGIAIFFALIEIVSFVFGFLLAKSITASVHNLAEGTERIKNGDLTYRIRVGAPDQLGDLANQFNSMTESIQNLLMVRAEKERLAEGLQIARQMQQNLLPRQVESTGSLEIAAMNLPAEEVCGDYYDILKKSDDHTGIIIADVSGKGPSAALYMAEVKGVMLSMSQRAATPRDILVEANRILAPTLDSRNFITMSCAMIDEPNKLMKMSRAGHNPILHYCYSSGKIEVVQPRGIGLGMGKNGMFESALEEVERKLCTGDILVFYTDGLTEAMNERQTLYGLERLSGILLKNQAFFGRSD